jgi:hypothetical protein
MTYLQVNHALAGRIHRGRTVLAMDGVLAGTE